MQYMVEVQLNDGSWIIVQYCEELRAAEYAAGSWADGTQVRVRFGLQILWQTCGIEKQFIA